MQDPNITADYKTLKKNQELNRTSANRSPNLNSSISMQRLDREFSPERKRGSIEQILNDDENARASATAVPKDSLAITTEQMIRDLVIDSDGEDEELFRNETLPGSVKSQYALKFRLDTDKANANFMQVCGVSW